MPLYEYHCQGCNHDVELLVRGSEQPICSECGSDKLQRLLSVVAAPVAGGGTKSAAEALPFSGCGKPGCAPGGCGRGMM